MAINYKDAGVDIQKGDALVESIKKKVQSTYGDRVEAGVGGFACLYKIDEERLLAAGTDGVGTKLMIAQKLGIHHTIGIDLVAMCVNDIICTGATPLFFMDYLACGKLNLAVSEKVLDGIVEGCRQGGMALIGGETAEMPGMYKDNDYDLAGFAVGEVLRRDLIDGSAVKDGDSLIALPSSGFHSNGYSLVRQLVKDNETELLSDLLTPTTIYTPVIKKLREANISVHGMAHITGGGFSNISRINASFDYIVDTPPHQDNRPAFMQTIIERSKLSDDDLYQTFNMGVGMVLITDTPDEVIELLQKADTPAWRMGQVVSGSGSVNFKHTQCSEIRYQESKLGKD